MAQLILLPKMTHLSPYSTPMALLSQHYNKVQCNNKCGALLHYLFCIFYIHIKILLYQRKTTTFNEHHIKLKSYSGVGICMYD